ncbi:MAG: hypothetical protein MUC83_17540 [Pirellula sp.]|nr:hypothetical protein [Pirellula sp.]
MRICFRSLIVLLCVLPLSVTGCGTRSQSDQQTILTEGVVDESLPKETKEAQQWLKKLLNAAKEGSGSCCPLFHRFGVSLGRSRETHTSGENLRRQKEWKRCHDKTRLLEPRKLAW